MSEKNSYYWQFHKKIMKIKLNELNNEIFNEIMSNPHGEESRNLNKIVDNLVELELMKLIPEEKYEE
jgi:hypothetical protein